MIDPTVFVSVAGLATTAAGYLAGRNRALSRTLHTVTATYEALVVQLRTEIDRLRQLLDLEALPTRRASSSSVRKVRPNTGL